MGDRLRGKIEKSAMQRANFIGNWVFAFLWSPILRSRPRDMLCGTKVFETEVFLSIPKILLKKDPYGDFSLVATARLLNKKVDNIQLSIDAMQVQIDGLVQQQADYAQELAGSTPPTVTGTDELTVEDAEATIEEEEEED